MDGWVISKCTQDSQKVCTKLLSLSDNAKKLNFRPSAKVKTLRVDLSWDHSTGQNTHLSSKTVILAVLAFK